MRVSRENTSISTRLSMQQKINCMIQGQKLLISQGEYESMEREHKLLHETVNAAENKLYDTRIEVDDLTRLV